VNKVAALERYVQAARRQMRVLAWRDSDVTTSFATLTHRRTQQQRLRVRRRWITASSLAVAASLLIVLGLVRKFEADVADTTATLLPLAHQVALGEDSSVRFDTGTNLDVLERSATRVTVRLTQGLARFHVRHDPLRLFRVEAGDVLIEDQGTIFTVQQQDGTVDVAVTEGAVVVAFTVDDERRRVTLGPGQRGSYKASPKSGQVASTIAQVDAPELPVADGSAKEMAGVELSPSDEPIPTGQRAFGSAIAPRESLGHSASLESSERGDVTGDSDWRKLAHEGEYQLAYTLLSTRRFANVGSSAGDLLLASDIARRARHPADSVPLLRKLLVVHPRDASAPSAAFALGWVLMSDLARPREAAAAFERAVELAPGGNLAQDARGRAVEAWQRAGDINRAKRQFELYKRQYPNGRHVERLQRLIERP
jgi:hypothetical protein